jgi:hypothetical protein
MSETRDVENTHCTDSVIRDVMQLGCVGQVSVVDFSVLCFVCAGKWIQEL